MQRYHATSALSLMLGQASAEHLQQCAQSRPWSARRDGIAHSVRQEGHATACAAVQSTAPLLRRWRPAGHATLGPRSALTCCLKLDGLLVSHVRLHCRGAKLTARQQRTTLTEASPPFSDGTL